MRTRIKLASLAVAAVGSLAISMPVWAQSGPAPVAQVAADASTPVTLAQLATHNGASSCWSAMNGKVYDLTTFSGSHDGGPAVILALCGKDVTSTFMNTAGLPPTHTADYFAANTPQVGVLSATATTPAATTPAATTPAATTPAATTPAAGTYTLAQVAAHKSATDCWTAIEGKVYDLTKFVNVHKNGSADIISLCGIDGTSAFSSSGHATSYFDTYTTKVGTLATGATTPAATTPAATTPAATTPAATTPAATTPAATTPAATTPAATKTATPAPVVKKITIKCQNIKTKKITKVTAVKPVCPKGTKLVK